jgi:hypothetical protein
LPKKCKKWHINFDETKRGEVIAIGLWEEMKMGNLRERNCSLRSKVVKIVISF